MVYAWFLGNAGVIGVRADVVSRLRTTGLATLKLGTGCIVNE